MQICVHSDMLGHMYTTGASGAHAGGVTHAGLPSPLTRTVTHRAPPTHLRSHLHTQVVLRNTPFPCDTLRHMPTSEVAPAHTGSDTLGPHTHLRSHLHAQVAPSPPPHPQPRSISKTQAIRNFTVPQPRFHNSSSKRKRNGWRCGRQPPRCL